MKDPLPFDVIALVVFLSFSIKVSFYMFLHQNDPARLQGNSPLQARVHQAFQYFFDLHHQSLYLIIKGSVGDPETAKDIVADASST